MTVHLGAPAYGSRNAKPYGTSTRVKLESGPNMDALRYPEFSNFINTKHFDELFNRVKIARPDINDNRAAQTLEALMYSGKGGVAAPCTTR